MSYGTPEWKPWLLGEEEGIAQIKFACVFLQIQGPEKYRLLASLKRGIFIFYFFC